ncbi:hypothetical protein VDGE_30629 [Verticillium dahliae]|uniref:DUF6594 domain-containing protein n=1 Tax=Verticillium dahliae TaxID=27337 RepID=A0A444RMA9_VERDA|nr:hypothetical protein VDGE_30629 [Verticillium dahliae]
MGQQPDLAIFMRFNALSAELLLHRQAEIVALRDGLWECQKNDNSAAKGTNRSERPSAVGDIPGTKRQIKGISSPDGFTNRWSLGFLYYYDKVIGHRIHATDEAEHSRNAIVYQNQRIMAVARTFKTIVACMFPIVAIITLYFIKTLPVRLGVIGGFTLFFALVLDKATSASVKDIFSATAAFSAVLVVFVGTTS